jgi:diacylglycerol kinase (ATP)
VQVSKEGPLAGLLRSFGYAAEGIAWMALHQRNMRVHIVSAVAVVGLGLGLGVPLDEWSSLVFAITLVLVAEALNSAVEAVMDLVHPERHDLVKIVKDVMAGAVLIAAAGAATIGGLVFLPRIVALFGG